MEAHPAHNSLPVKAKMEAMDVLTWAWTGNNGFLSTHSHCLYSSFYSRRTSPSLPLCCSCSFHSGRMPRIDDAYSILWRYVTDIIYIQQIYLCMRRQMTMMTTESKRALFLGFFSELVSRFLPSTSSIWLTTIINAKPTGVKPTSDRTNRFLLMQAQIILAFQ